MKAYLTLVVELWIPFYFPLITYALGAAVALPFLWRAARGHGRETAGWGAMWLTLFGALLFLNAVMRTETCYKCHQDKRAEMNKISHHPVREGKMTCFTCHDPHGSITTKNLRAPSVNELCYNCHTEKRGPFLWEHAPVRENCLSCHTPHGSNHLKLQQTSVPFLCQQCHANTRHPGTLYDATRLPQQYDPSTGVNRIFNRACVQCHAAIHGSNHPSAPYLGH